MKARGYRAWFAVCLVTVILLVGLVGACAEPAAETAPTTPAPATPAPALPEPTMPEAPTISEPPMPEPAAPEPAAPEPTTPAPAEAHWWDKLGEPQYGGTFTQAAMGILDNFDPYISYTSQLIPFETLIMWDMTIDREEWSYKVSGAPPKFAGLLAESWEWEDPVTLVLHLRQNVKWHNKQPTYGREFTSEDVVYHYDRRLGLGEFDQPNPFDSATLAPIANVVARDKYTVAVNFKEPTTLANWWAITDPMPANQIEPRELAESEGTDWHNSAGTGPFMVTDYVSGSSITYSKNPDYYLYDERYPDNRLPYFDEMKTIAIVDRSTQLAAIRSGQVDILTNLDNWQSANSLQKTNPELVVTSKPYMGLGLDMRLDKEPFTDINVRKALQLAINIPDIAENYYGGLVSSDPPGYMAAEYVGWTRPYAEWPEDLQQEYMYDPDRARQLLADAGYPDGFETNVVAKTADDIDLLQIMKGYFADIGVDMTINTMDSNEWFPFTQQGKHDQMYANFFYNQIFPINVCVLNRTSMQSNNCIYAPPEEIDPYDELYVQFTKVSDVEEAKQLMLQAEEYIYRHHWAIIATARAYYDVHQPRLRGFSGEDIGPWNGSWLLSRLWLED